VPGLDTPAGPALDSAGVAYRVVTHGPVASLTEAAAARGVEPVDVIKTLVVRRGEGDYLFVLVPGDRVISWPKLRALLGVSRLSMPGAADAKTATGYARGTITPFGSTVAWPVIADARMAGRTITLGGGAHGVAIALAADDVVRALHATVADVTDPEPATTVPGAGALPDAGSVVGARAGRATGAREKFEGDRASAPAPGRRPDLVAFLTEFLGDWPAESGLHVVGSTVRTRPGWDGAVHDLVGVGTPERAVISVRPERADAVQAAVRTWADISTELPTAAGRPDASAFFGKFRWTTTPSDLPDAGVWVDASDLRVPAWLKPFGGQVLIAFIDDVYAAGVGIKRHNAAGLELAVGTDEAHRGKGLATRLVSQAARWVLAKGAVPIYLHDPENIASDRTATAAGFPDEGWKIIGLGGDRERSSP
jgi:Cys-tRNA(Pro) deacylase